MIFAFVPSRKNRTSVKQVKNDGMEINRDECEFDCDAISDLSYQIFKIFYFPRSKVN